MKFGYLFSEISVNLLPPDVIKAKNAPNAVSAGPASAPLQTPLGELTALPKLSCWI